MGVIPTRVQDQLAFFNSHAATWASAPPSIGLTAAQVTAFATLAATAQESYDTQQSNISKARQSTATAKVAVRDARESAAGLIALIKAFAENQANPQSIYEAADIPAPAAPSPMAPPGMPFEPRVELLQTGAIVLSWKCSNPEGAQGTIYEVLRRIGGSGAFTLIGGTGVRSFTDDTIPQGSGSVYYRVTGVRSTTRGQYATFAVQFGVDGPGLSVTQVAEVKMAA